MIIFSRILLIVILVTIGMVPAVAQKPSKDVFGQNIGASNWGPLTTSQSQLSVTSDAFKIARREGQNLPNRYQEKLGIKNGGWISYEELFNSSSYFTDTYSPEEYLVDISNKNLKKSLKIAFTLSDVRKSTFEEGDLFFAIKSSATDICAVFNAKFGVTGAYGRYGGKHSFGGSCRKLRHVEAKELGKRIFSFIHSIRFDDGKLNKVKGAIEEDGVRRQTKKVTDHFENAKPAKSTGGGKVNLLACFNNPEKCKK